MVVQTSDTTWQAYNDYGGNSLYKCAVDCPPGNPPATRPRTRSPTTGRSDDRGVRRALFTGAEYPMIRFLEANGYDARYVSGVDVHRRGALLRTTSSSSRAATTSTGPRASAPHGGARASRRQPRVLQRQRGLLEDALGAERGGHETADRTLVSYKDTHFNGARTRSSGPAPGATRASRPPAENSTPENALTGQHSSSTPARAGSRCPTRTASSACGATPRASLAAPDKSLALAPDTLGYEWDVDADNGFRPGRLVPAVVDHRQQRRSVHGLRQHDQVGGTATHNMTLYRASSGARVFGAGTVQWALGLDALEPGENPPDRNMQQATVNLFADMGAQPATRLSGLVAATATTDTTKPTATMTAPPATVADGTASRSAAQPPTRRRRGGRRRGLDRRRRHLAPGHRHGVLDVLVGRPRRADRDDQGPRDRRQRQHRDAAAPGDRSPSRARARCGATASRPAAPTPVTPARRGRREVQDRHLRHVTGVRFYKAAANTGTHIGSLWTADGAAARPGDVQRARPASGWQTVDVRPAGRGAAEHDLRRVVLRAERALLGHGRVLLRAPVARPERRGDRDSPPLHALRNSGTTTNGVYSYGAGARSRRAPTRPRNYWVDVMFAPTPAPGQVTGVTAAEGGRDAPRTCRGPRPPRAARRRPTRSRRTSARPRRRRRRSRRPPPTTTTVTGLTTGHDVPFRVPAIEPERRRARVGASNAVTPPRRVVRRRRPASTAQPARSRRGSTWTAPAADGDSPITG